MHPAAPLPRVVANEELREALLTAERQRVDEQRARMEAETLLRGLHLLAEAQGVQELFFGILQIVRDVVPYSDAAVLGAAGQRLEVMVATDEALTRGLAALPTSGVVRRALNGRPVAVTDLSMIAEWAELPADLHARFSSGLLLPIRTGDQPGLFICLHTDRAAFSRHQLAVLEYFTPLIAQAIHRSRELHERDNMISRLEHLAQHDVLTGLGNRALFSQRLNAAIARAESSGHGVGIVHLDMDNFKVINDTMGHAAGDLLLETVGERLRDTLRDVDCVARMGGDEFAVVLAELAVPQEAVHVAERLLDAVAAPMSLSGQVIYPSVSIGVATYPHDGRTAEQVLSHADIALYEAKGAGRARVSSFEARMRSELQAAKDLEHDLRRGLDADEIVVFYQPIVRATDGVVAGLEALIRWNHPTHGLLPPARFLDVAERSELVCALGQRVLERALHETAEWLLAGPHRRLAVNVAARQLLTPSFPEEVVALLQQYGLPADALELELSEEIIARRAANAALETLQHLDRLGIELAFDDFGTGYSSVFQLRSFPGHRLKIDRSFVDRMLVDDTDKAIVQGMIHLAHGLRLKVVAEGVETLDQMQALTSYGCDELQGFHIGRPAPFGELSTSRTDPTTRQLNQVVA